MPFSSVFFFNLFSAVSKFQVSENTVTTQIIVDVTSSYHPRLLHLYYTFFSGLALVMYVFVVFLKSYSRVACKLAYLYFKRRGASR